MTIFDTSTLSLAFAPFAEAAMAAERVYAIDLRRCVLSCRRSMVGMVKWMYFVDETQTLFDCMLQ